MERGHSSVIVADDFAMIEVGLIAPMDSNPRKNFDEHGLIELTESIKEHGVIQPLVVRATVHGFDLVAGERRWRSAQRAGLDMVPCVVRNLTDLEVAEIQLIENIDRHQLTPMEESAGVCHLVELGMDKHDLAGKLARSDEWVQLRLDLPSLPGPARAALECERFGLGAAEQLLRVSEGEREAATQVLLELGDQLTTAQVKEILRARYHEPRRRREAWNKLVPELERKFGERSAAVTDVEVSHDFVHAWGAGIGHWVSTDDEVGGMSRHPAESVITWGELADVHNVKTTIVCAGVQVCAEAAVEVVDKRIIVDAERALREQGKPYTLGPRKAAAVVLDNDESDDSDDAAESDNDFILRHVMSAIELRPDDEQLCELLMPVLELIAERK